MKTTPPTAAPATLLAARAAGLRQQGKALLKEKTDGIRARAVTESTLRSAARQRLAAARTEMAALRARLSSK